MTNDYDDRLARLNAAGEGDTVTIPEGWTRPPGRGGALLRLRPGDVLTNDGTGIMEWLHERARDWFSSRSLALAGLDVDPAADDDEDGSEPIGYVSDVGIALDSDGSDDGDPLCCGCADCGRLCRGCASCKPDGDQGSDDEDEIGTAYVRIVPTVDRLRVTEPAVAALHEDQLERVAALAESLRLLESRRGPSGGGGGLREAIAGKPDTVPMVGTRPLIDVAAFIFNGDTGRTGGDA